MLGKEYGEWQVVASVCFVTFHLRLMRHTAAQLRGSVMWRCGMCSMALSILVSTWPLNGAEIFDFSADAGMLFYEWSLNFINLFKVFNWAEAGSGWFIYLFFYRYKKGWKWYKWTLNIQYKAFLCDGRLRSDVSEEALVFSPHLSVTSPHKAERFDCRPVDWLLSLLAGVAAFGWCANPLCWKLCLCSSKLQKAKTFMKKT